MLVEALKHQLSHPHASSWPPHSLSKLDMTIPADLDAEVVIVVVEEVHVLSCLLCCVICLAVSLCAAKLVAVSLLCAKEFSGVVHHQG